MNRRERWIVIEARHSVRLDASREQVLDAELDFAFMRQELGVETRDVIESPPGVPHRWLEVASWGPVRRTVVRTLISMDPHVIRTEYRDTQMQTGVTTVEAERGADGLLGVEWAVRAELTAKDPLSRWLLRVMRHQQQRSLERGLAKAMARWGAAVEQRAARECA